MANPTNQGTETTIPTAPTQRGSGIGNGSAEPCRRTRVTTACLRCRTKKIKCDGQKPVCSPCVRQNTSNPSLPCSWDYRTDRRSSKHWASTRASVQSGNSRSLSSPNNSPSLTCEASTPSLTTSGGASYSTLARSQPDIQSHAPLNEKEPLSYGHVGQEIEQALRDKHCQRTLGTASVVPLAANIQRRSYPQSTSQDQPIAPFPSSEQGQQTNLSYLSTASQNLSEVDLELPQRNQADHLLRIYCESFHPVFPVLDVLETQEAYARLWTTDGAKDLNRTFMCIVNVVFALASRVNTHATPKAREQASARYCTRALELLNNRRVPCISFQSIQANLLMAEYLHSIHPEQCWMHVGTAIRMAQSLGLHRLRGRSCVRSSKARILVHRVWFLCIVWDRIICSTYGRQLMISRKEAEAVASSSEHLPSEYGGMQSDAVEPVISAFLEKSLELYSIVARGLEDFSVWDLGLADPADASSANAPLDQVVEHERLLSKFKIRVDTFPDGPGAPGKLQRRLSVILHQRIQQARIVLLRPIFSMHLRQEATLGSSYDLSRQITVQCSASCVAAAVEAIEIIHSREHSNMQKNDPAAVSCTNAWWNNVLYLYSAATALIAACICQDVASVIGRTLVDNAWALAMALLHRYSFNGPWVQRLNHLLESLATKTQTGLISSDQSQHGSNLSAAPTNSAAEHDHTLNMQPIGVHFRPSRDFSYPGADELPFDLSSTDPLVEDIDIDAFLEYNSDPFTLLDNGVFGG